MSDNFIRSATFHGFQNLVFELGGDPESIFGEIGLSEAQLMDPDAVIPVDSFQQALNLAADKTATPRFGLLLAQRQSFEILGAVGYATKHAPDLRTAINELCAYLGTHDVSADSALTVDGKVALWTYENNAFESGSVLQHVEHAIGLGVNFIRSALGQSWNPIAIYCRHSKPADCTLYARLLRCPVYFDETVNGIEFDAEALDRKLAHAEQRLYGILHTHLEMIGKREKRSFADRTAATIVANLEKGVIGIESTAEAMGMSRTRLQRKLSSENASFQELMDRVRHDLACRYLRDTEMPLTTISSVLCYSELAAFSRAFKRRTGQSPSAWRQTAPADAKEAAAESPHRVRS